MTLDRARGHITLRNVDDFDHKGMGIHVYPRKGQGTNCIPWYPGSGAPDYNEGNFEHKNMI